MIDDLYNFGNHYEIDSYFNGEEDFFSGDKCSKSEHHEWEVTEKRESGFAKKTTCIHCGEIHICDIVVVPAREAKISYKMPILFMPKHTAIPNFVPNFIK